MAAVLAAAILAVVFTTGHCASDDDDLVYTVTDEVWFEVTVKGMYGAGEDYVGRFEVAVFGEVVPLTSLNFVSIARGYKKKTELMSYKDCRIHRIVQDFVIQMGDITANDGTGGTSIYGRTFADENFQLSHRSPGWMAMANRGPRTNTSQFYIMMTRARWLDGRNVVFGKVIRGWDVVETLSNVPANKDNGEPRKYARISDCGVNDLMGKYHLTEAQLDATEDIPRHDNPNA